MSFESSQESDYTETRKSHKPRPRKRVKHIKEEFPDAKRTEFPLEPLLSVLWTYYGKEDSEDNFDRLIEPMLGDLLRARENREKHLTEVDESGKIIRPLRRPEVTLSIEELVKKAAISSPEALILRKLKLEQQRSCANIKEPKIAAPGSLLTPLPSVLTPPVNLEVLDALYAIKTTPFANSLLSRLHGATKFRPGLIAVDWETRTPWMNLMTDIHDHYTFAHPERECPMEEPAPITYFTLHAYHLPQVHDLLERSFWPGINVSDSLDYQPEKSTVIAMYKKVVVGVAIIISPIQTYITYLAVKAGWDKAQIARTMLYHLIKMNSDKDITLHVSTNNSAMLLYNQFGFKVEEFVAGFYSEYLDADSRASKNAFKLRLRHLQQNLEIK